MNGNKDSNSNICIHMSKSKFSKNEIRSTNGVIMKKLFTIKHSLINNNSIIINRGRSNNIEREGRRGGEVGVRERERRGKRGKEERSREGRGRNRITDMKTLLILPLIGAISIYFKPTKQWALLISVVTMLEAVRIYVGMDKKSTEYQYVERIM